MNDQINRKIAEALGWTDIWDDFGTLRGHDKDGRTRAVPDFTGSLDCMHEAEKTLTYWPDYLFFLREIVGPFPDAQCEWTDYHWRDVVHATARQRAEAFLRTRGLWED
jgi:hypothetical protein